MHKENAPVMLFWVVIVSTFIISIYLAYRSVFLPVIGTNEVAFNLKAFLTFILIFTGIGSVLASIIYFIAKLLVNSNTA